MKTSLYTPQQQRTAMLFSEPSSTGEAIDTSFEVEHEFIDGANGNKVLVLKKVPVFRSGEFSDSLGREHLWEDLHMHQMVANFIYLKTKGIFSNVPIRADHPSFAGDIMKNVVGYNENLAAEEMVCPIDGVTYTYLFSDMHIIHKEAQDAVLSELWRTRSSEIGPYATNAKAELWPTFTGVAFVDIPAVEGLEMRIKRFSKATDDKYSLIMEAGMTGTTVDPSKLTPPSQTAPKHQFSLPGVTANSTTDDFAKVQELLNTQFARIQTLETEAKAKDTELTSLRGFAKETRDAARADFVKGLVKDNKILGTEEQETLEMVTEMDDKQFTRFTKIMGAAPQVPVLGKYGQQPVETGAPGSQQRSADDENKEKIAILVDQVMLHKNRGVPADKIKEFGSYKDLLALDKAAAERIAK